jgi:hypothetical protein
MKKLPPNAKRVILNGNPYIAHEDPVTKKIRLEDDYGAKLAKMPVNARLQALKSNKTRVVSRGKALSNAR